MLVLSRTVSERIRIADDIIITIVSVRGEKVRVGIEAPAEVPIHRQEIYEKIYGGSEPCGGQSDSEST